MQKTSNLPQNPPLQQTAVIRWPDSVRLKMIEKSNPRANAIFQLRVAAKRYTQALTDQRNNSIL